jgi:hypothetical protein
MDDYLSRKSRLTVWSSTIRHNLEKNAASVGNPGVRPVRYPAHFSTSTHPGKRNHRKRTCFALVRMTPTFLKVPGISIAASTMGVESQNQEAER